MTRSNAPLCTLFAAAPTISALLLLLLCQLAAGAIAPNGSCPILIFVPFTNNGTSTVSFSGGEERSNPAFTFLAAALLAAEHFNSRDASVVPELSSLGAACNVQIDLEHSFAFDTGTIGHNASRRFIQHLSSSSQTTGALPCAIVGPYSDIPAMELSVLASSTEIPMVVARSTNQRVVLDEFSPFTSQVWPDLFENSRLAVEFLLQRNRTDFISLLYTVSDNNIQRRELIAWQLDFYGITWEAQPLYKVGAISPLESLQRVKSRGYRTIIVCLDNYKAEFPVIAEAADALGMNNGDYFWFWFGYMDPVYMYSLNPTYQRILRGSGMVLPIEMYMLVFETEASNSSDPFLQAWRSVDQGFIDRLNELNPMSEDEIGYEYADENFFERQRPEWGSGYLYDAVMTVGIGACLASSQSTNTSSSTATDLGSIAATTGSAHLEGIRNAKFRGSTGKIEFTGGEFDTDPGARLPETMTYFGANLLPSLLDDEASPDENVLPYRMTDVWYAGSEKWTTVIPFIYADGRTVPPDFLRDPPDQNFISPGLQALGLALMSMVWFAGIANLLWIYMHRKHRILAASQPFFLYTMTVGCIIMASTIFTMSFDESDGWSQSSLSTACAVTPWPLTLGQIVIYGSLFAKLWRVQQVMQFARRKIMLKQVAWPSAGLIVAALVVLTVWTAAYPMVWEREEVNEDTGDSMGKCTGEHSGAFIGVLLVLMLIPTLLTGFMAWKTKDVSDEFSEAKWIWILIVIQLEVLIVAVPTVVILGDVSSDGRYIGTFPFLLVSLYLLREMREQPLTR